MVSFGKSGGESQQTSQQGSVSDTVANAFSTTTPSPYLEPAASAMLGNVQPLNAEFSKQLLEGLRTGGVGAQIPIISKAVEESKRALSGTLQGIEAEMARTGLSGTPFGTRQKAETKRAGEYATSQIPTNYIAELLKLIPGWVGQKEATAIGALGTADYTKMESGTTSSSSSWGSGQGTSGQAATNIGILTGCCFLFLAIDGYLHPVIRAYRDTHMTRRSVRGYYWLSDRLVPAMRRWRWLRSAMRLSMTRPLTSYARYYYGLSRLGFILIPLACLWLATFRILSPSRPYTRRGTKEVI